MSYYTASGEPPGAWAGTGAERPGLMRVCVKCMTGLEDVWISRRDGAPHLEDTQHAEDRGEGQP